MHVNFRPLLFVAMLLAAATLGVAQAQTGGREPAKVVTSGSSSMLVDSGGMTLYTYDPDTNGKSTCYLMCQQNWPPFVGNAASQPVGNYTIITRDDGSKQWAYNGKPLYYWHNDKVPGDKTGDNIGRVWHVAKP